MENSIKKTISLLTAVFMALAILSMPITVNAASPVNLTLTSVNGISGRDITVSLNISADSKLAAGDLTVSYDSEKLLYKSSKEGPAAAGGLSVINPNTVSVGTTKSIKQGFISAEGTVAEGSMLDITFTVAPGWSGTTELTLAVGDFYDSNYNMMDYTITKGIVTVDGSPGTSTTAQASSDTSETAQSSSEKTITIALIVVAVLVLGAAGAFFIIKKKH